MNGKTDTVNGFSGVVGSIVENANATEGSITVGKW